MFTRAWLLVPSSIGAISCIKWKSAIAEDVEQDTLLLVHVFHRHGDRTPWFAINDPEQSKNIWHPTIAKRYSLFDSEGKTNLTSDTVYNWERITEKLNGLSLIYKEDNWDSSSETLFDSTKESSASKLVEMTTWDNHDHPFLGQLTDKGCQQLEAVGDLLRNRYVDTLNYLPSEYESSSSKLQCHSTNMARTIQSADCVLGTLYPMEMRKDDLIPLHVDIDQTPLSPFNQIWKWCEELKHKAIAHQKKVMSSFDEQFDELLNAVTSHYPSSDSWNVTTHGVAFDQMVCRLSHNIEDIPPMFNWDSIRQLGQYLTKIVCAQMSGDRDTLKLTFGKALNNMLKEMNAAKDTKGDEGKMIITSCHDDTLLALLCSVYGESIHDLDMEWPDYASYLIFELWKDASSGKRVVKVLYNGVPLDIFDGQNRIDLEDLQKKWSDVIH